MIHNLAHHLPILDIALDLLRQRTLRIILDFIPVALAGDIDVDAGALAREELGRLTAWSEIHRRAVNLVEENRRQAAEDLHREPRGLDHVDG